MDKRQRTPEEIWKALEKEALGDDAELERAASMSADDVARQLAAAGVDVKKEQAEARAIRAGLERSIGERQRAKEAASRARVRSLRPQAGRPVVVWLAVAATGVAAGGGLLYAGLKHRHAERPHPAPSAAPTTPAPPPESSAPLIAADDLRRRAFDACDAKRWDECLSLLDEARDVDPAGDADPRVEAARQAAAEHIDDKLPPVPVPSEKGPRNGDKPPIK